MTIKEEEDLKNYLTGIGLTNGSNSSYRSRLKFLLSHNLDINSEIVSGENILSILKEREIYYKDRSSLKTALTTYKRYLSSDFNLIQDLQEIEQQKISQTEKEILLKARIGQGEFRKKLVMLWQKCSLSQLQNVELLIASHILPWKNSNNIERLDKYNGLLLLPNYDKLFDRGYISFNDNGTIILSRKLNTSEFERMGINAKSRLTTIWPENIPYLKRHREIFKETLFGK